MKRTLFVVVVVVALIATWMGADAYRERVARQERIREAEQVAVPKPVPKPVVSSSAAAVPPPVVASQPSQPPLAMRDEVNWDVPFTPQAPFAVWDAVHKEACEEASALMVLRYFADKPFSSADEADSEIVRLVGRSGPAVDETAQEVADLIELENSWLDVSLLNNPTEASLKEALDDGKLIIVPAAGRQLGNPYFQSPGPPYHMLVLRGYTKDGYVITNDPGTKRGENFAYRWSVLINAIHDWNGGDVDNGAKVVVVIGE